MENKFVETPDTVHGRLMESVETSGYTMGRSCKSLEWLLEDDRWKQVGTGFDDINMFLETIDLSRLKIAIEERKALSKRLQELDASQRATAKALGVSEATVNRDIKPVTNVTKEDINYIQDRELKNSDVTNVTPKPFNDGWDDFIAAEKGTPEKPNVHVSNNSGENEWYTPEYIIDAARNAMGSIDLDPASCEAANLTVNAEEYYTKENDGLNRKWHGNIWLNPPYAQPLITNFCERVASERDNYNQAIVLVNNATETVWFRYLVSVADAICFTNGRVKFIDKAGDPSGAPLQGQAVVYVGDNFAAFYENFKEIGWIAKIEE